MKLSTRFEIRAELDQLVELEKLHKSYLEILAYMKQYHPEDEKAISQYEANIRQTARDYNDKVHGIEYRLGCHQLKESA